MPWFPEFFSAVELARNQTRTAGLADPAGQYFTALENGDTHVLESTWPGQVTVYDPRAGEIRGHRRLRRFVLQNRTFFAERHARSETVAATCVTGRAVVELLVHLDVDGQEVIWPVAVVADSPDALSVVFRTYCSRLPVDGRRYIRSPILDRRDLHPPDVIGRYLTAQATGDTEGAVNCFATGGYLREPIGSQLEHSGTAELRSYFSRRFSTAGGIGLESCEITDDGLRCALEYNCFRWGSERLPPQAGLAVYERGPDGLLAAARIYDDIELPIDAHFNDPTSRTNQVEQQQPREDPAERELFETIRTTYPLALEQEQHAMVTELKDNMSTIPLEERVELINDIQQSIGRIVEEEFEL